MPSAVTRIRFGLAVMVMGWSGPGSFIVSTLCSACRDRRAAIRPFLMNRNGNIVSQQVTFKASGARFACHGRVIRPRFEPETLERMGRGDRLGYRWTPTISNR